MSDGDEDERQRWWCRLCPAAYYGTHDDLPVADTGSHAHDWVILSESVTGGNVHSFYGGRRAYYEINRGDMMIIPPQACIISITGLAEGRCRVGRLDDTASS